MTAVDTILLAIIILQAAGNLSAYSELRDWRSNARRLTVELNSANGTIKELREKLRRSHRRDPKTGRILPKGK